MSFTDKAQKGPSPIYREWLDELFAAVEHFRRRDTPERFDSIMEQINELFPEFDSSQAYSVREILIMQAEWMHQTEGLCHRGNAAQTKMI